MTTPIVLRKCIKCERELPETTDYFGRYSDGWRFWCKQCVNEHYLQQNKRPPFLTPEQRRELVKERSRDAYRKSPESHRRAMAKYYRKNVDEFRDRNKRYQRDNPRVVAVAQQRRRSRVESLPSDFTDSDWCYALDYWDNRCAYCGKKPDFWTRLAMEHFIAVKDERPTNPGTVPGNIIPACHTKKGAPVGHIGCNQSKHNRDPIEWVTNRFGKRKGKRILDAIQRYFLTVRKV